jgi:MFS family permease
VTGYLRNTFESLHNRSFRLFMAGHAVSQIGNWMQKVAQAWLVLELTDSGTLLGLTAALQQLPTLVLTPWGGLLADRFDKRKILIITQAASAVPALLLGILAATGWVTLWMILVLAVALGSIECFEKPARHTFPIEMVGPEHLTNAIALSNIVINGGKVVGPAVAGILITTVGLPISFFVNALSFGAVLAGLLLIRPSQLHRSPPALRAPGQLREGLRYVRREPVLLGPLVLMAVTGMLAYEWIVTLPLLAREGFDGDAGVAGLMFTAMGAGAIVGGLAIAGWLKASTNRLVISGLIFSAVLIVVAITPSLVMVYVMLFVLGAASIAFRAVATSLIQLRSAPEMRGRVMALLVVAIGGTTPAGGPLLGWVAELLGPRAPFLVGGIFTALAAVITYLYLRRRDSAPADHMVVRKECDTEPDVGATSSPTDGPPTAGQDGRARGRPTVPATAPPTAVG